MSQISKQGLIQLSFLNWGHGNQSLRVLIDSWATKRGRLAKISCLTNNRAVSNDDERLATSQTGFRGRCHEVLVFGRPYLDVIEPPSKPVTTDTNAVAPTRRPRATRRRNTSDRKTQTRLTSFFLGGLEKKLFGKNEKKEYRSETEKERSSLGETIGSKSSVFPEN